MGTVNAVKRTKAANQRNQTKDYFNK